MKKSQINTAENENEEVSLLTEDLEKATSLEALSNSDGGKVLLDALTTDIVSAVEKLTNYKDKSQTDFIVICADLSNKLTIVRSITRAKDNTEYLKNELAKALQQ